MENNREKELQSRWQTKMNQQEQSSKYREDMARYHQKKAQYYAAMAHATPWGWWYKLKAGHHQRIVRDHARQAKYHQAKILRYQLKANKNDLRFQRSKMPYHRPTKWYYGGPFGVGRV